MRTTLHFSALFILILQMVIPLSATGNGREITENDAIKIAVEYLEQLDINTENSTIEAKKLNTPVNDCLYDPTVHAEARKKLEGRTYWYIYFEPVPENPKHIIMGGDICVFIDAETGEVIERIGPF